ncbi:MAG: amidophosphoribosyltransferase [Chloroflexota bacterium]
MHESCGIFGVYAPGLNIARLTFFALFALQHRGQEGAGIAVTDGDSLSVSAGPGLVSHVFEEDDLSRLTGHASIGHTCYSAAGSHAPAVIQPIAVQLGEWRVAVAHNGNITNSVTLRSELETQGCSFETSSDAEVIAWLIATAHGATWQEKVTHSLSRLQGSYSLAILTPETLIAARDPMGVRPLCMGTLDGGRVVASESCALDHIGARFERDVIPGETVFINTGQSSHIQQKDGRRASCVFEHIYFARPDSTIEGRLVYRARLAMGAKLAEEYPVDADLVVGVPDSATAAAIGYSQASGIPYREGLLKNRYVGRTFIAPDQRLRDLGVQLKFNPLASIIRGRRIIVVDDSIVRGTTTPRVVNLLRQAGASEVHLRICAPPLRHPCALGVDMASEWELIAARMSVPEIQEYLGVDSLGYLSIEGLIEAVGLPRELLCLACINGEYPLPVQMGLAGLGMGN